MKLEQDVCNGSKRKQIYKCGWLWQTGYYAKTKRKGGRGMREGWEYKKLGEMASSELGKTLNKSKDTGKLYPYICAVNVLWDMIDLTILKHAFFEKEEIDRYSVRKGDLLVCEGGDTGRSAIWEKEEPVLYQNALHRVRFTTEMEARFAMYCLWHLKNNGQIDQKYSKGVTIKHLVKSSLLSIELPVPPLSTQQSIVSELDKINELISLKKEQLKDYDNLAQSIFYEMFGDPVVNEKGWEVKKLREGCECITDGDHMPPPKSDKGVPFVTIGNINKETRQIEFDKTFFVPKDYFDNIPYTKKPKQGDILYTVTGSYGIPLLIAYDKEFCFQRHIGLLRPNGLVNSIYLYMWASNKSVKGLADVVATGIAQKTVSLNSLRGFNITLPPLPLQQLFAQRIELIEKQKAEVQRTIADLETLLASRMQYWFD